MTARLAWVVAVAAISVVAACGSDDGSTPTPSDVTQTVRITASEYAFGADASTRIVAGDVVEFELTNVGQLDHELQVLDGSGRLLDRVERVEPGASGSVVIEFVEAGVYQFICDIDDHLSRGQRATFEVDEAVSEE